METLISGPSIVAALALILSGVLGLGMFRLNRKLTEEQIDLTDLSGEEKRVTTIIEYQERMDSLWNERNTCRQMLDSLERRIVLLEAELYRFGGDPKTINGGRK